MGIDRIHAPGASYIPNSSALPENLRRTLTSRASSAGIIFIPFLSSISITITMFPFFGFFRLSSRLLFFLLSFLFTVPFISNSISSSSNTAAAATVLLLLLLQLLLQPDAQNAPQIVRIYYIFFRNTPLSFVVPFRLNLLNPSRTRLENRKEWHHSCHFIPMYLY